MLVILLILGLLLFVPIWNQRVKSGTIKINTIEMIFIITGSMYMDKNTSNAQVNTYSFNQVFYIDLGVAKSKYPEGDFFKPNGTEIMEVFSMLELELQKNNYTEASKRNIQLVGQIVNGKKQIYAFMWTMGSPLDEGIDENKYNPERDYLTNKIFDGGSQYIDAVVSLDKNSDYYSALVISFDPHGEA